MSSAKEKILSLVADYEQRLKKLLESRPMLRGSVGRVFTRCGKPNCWCAKSQTGHPHTRMTWSQEGQMVTRKVPAEALKALQVLTRQYRQFRTDRRVLGNWQARLERLLDRYEELLIQQARRSFASLSLKRKMRRNSKKTTAKQSMKKNGD